MYSKSKVAAVPSDAQAREKLALYVYEYLLHVGASKAAQTFLTEIRWEKNITLGEPPGFLHAWWCVFWDLYCAAPERRDTCDHSNEAKAFHDYGFVNSGYNVNAMPHGGGPTHSPMPQMPPGEGIPGGPMSRNFFPYMNPRFSGPRPGVRMPSMDEFGGAPGQPMMPGGMDPTRSDGDFGGWQVPPSMSPMNRMNAPRGSGMAPMGSGLYGPGMRGPMPGSMGPGGAGMQGPPMQMPGVGRGQWPPNSSAPMNYSSSSPVSYGGPPGSAGPGAQLMPGNPQDLSNPGGEGMFQMMKSVPGGNMTADFSMVGGPDGGPLGQMPTGQMMGGNGMESMKNSPSHGGPGTPRDDTGGLNDYNLGGFGGQNESDQTESAAIQKIKESMQEEAKRFEKDSEHQEYFGNP